MSCLGTLQKWCIARAVECIPPYYINHRRIVAGRFSRFGENRYSLVRLEVLYIQGIKLQCSFMTSRAAFQVLTHKHARKKYTWRQATYMLNKNCSAWGLKKKRVWSHV